MEFKPDKPYRRISGKGALVVLQSGHVFTGKDVYVGPEPKGSGSMSPQEILAAAAEKKPEPKPEKKKVIPKKVVDPMAKPRVGLFLGEKPKSKSYKRKIGRG